MITTIKWYAGIAINRAGQLLNLVEKDEIRLKRAMDFRDELIKVPNIRFSLTNKEVDDLLFLIQFLEDQLIKESQDRL